MYYIQRLIDHENRPCVTLRLPRLWPEDDLRYQPGRQDLGFSSLWTYERLFWAVNPRDRYAGHYDPWPERFKYMSDPLDVLNFIAARTRRIKLGTSVINSPFYNPVLLARRLNTIDILSNCRLIIGMGIGWSKDEFETVGVPMTRRGDRMDEFVKVLDTIWSDGPAQFQSKFYQLPEVEFGLKPVQKPRPPLLLGTYSLSFGR